MTHIKPKLRFKEFKDEWQGTKLNNLVNSFDYGLNASSKKYDGKNKYLRITDIDNETRLFKYDDLTTPNINLNNKDNYLLHNGNVVFSRTGASTGKTYLYHDEDGKVYFAGFLIRADINDLSDGGFIFNYTLTTKYDNFIKINSMRSGQPGINSKELGTLKINIPSVNEQRKIGIFLNKIDDLIQLKGNKIDSLERLKRGYIQKLFTDPSEDKPKLRFKGFNDVWKKIKMGKISSYKNGKGLEKFAINGGEKIIINLNSISIDGYLKDSGKRLPKDFKDTLNKGDLIMILSDIAHGNLIGMTAVIPENDLYALNQRVGLIKLNDGISPEFMSFQLNSMQKHFKKKSAGTSQLNLSKGDIMNSYIRNPNFDEQSKIANFMDLIDKQINLQQKELDRLKSLKKGYLQKLFV